MAADIVPGLLGNILETYKTARTANKIIQNIEARIGRGQATYADANEYALEIGKLVADAFAKHLSSSTLPDGRMYFNIADRIIGATLEESYASVVARAVEVQTELNKKAGIGLKGIKPELNQDRVDGIINKVSNAEVYDDVAWVLDEPVVNFNQSIIDDTIESNLEFQGKSGLSPTITRTCVGGCCDWCREIAGVYSYPNVPQDVYRRHRYCRCTCEYDPGDGKRRNVHAKDLTDPEKDARIEVRKKIGINPEKETAERLRRIAENQEPQVTNDLMEISKRTGSEMEGLDFRLKTVDSLARKIEKDPDAKIRDVLRYTNISDGENQVDNYSKMVEQLGEKGYSMTRVKNYWTNTSNPYNGINTNIITPSGYEFELQFHTKESFDLKNGKLHELYEKQRLIKDKRSAEYIKLNDEMFELSSSLKVPEQISEVE